MAPRRVAPRRAAALQIPRLPAPCSACDGTGHEPDDRARGRWLRAQREQTGLTIRALAERIGYSPVYVGRVENGGGASSEFVGLYCEAVERAAKEVRR